MQEKRSKSNKYIRCYCSKHSEVLVGIDAYKYFNTFAMVVGIVFTLWALSSNISLVNKLILVAVLGLPAVLLPPYNYKYAKRIMQKADHSENCSRKIARIVMFRASLWSEFKIIDV